MYIRIPLANASLTQLKSSKTVENLCKNRTFCLSIAQSNTGFTENKEASAAQSFLDETR